jgi:hypothetical protein
VAAELVFQPSSELLPANVLHPMVSRSRRKVWQQHQGEDLPVTASTGVCTIHTVPLNNPLQLPTIFGEEEPR